jgi:hypothetical protein
MQKPDRAKKPIQFFCATLPWKQLPDYPDIGSYKCNEDNSPAFVGAADTGNDISNCAILMHEITESFLCWLHGVKEEDISAWDKKWFAEEKRGVRHIHDGPGDDPAAPYHTWHLVAERLEREFITQCGMSWEEHEENCERVYKGGY